MPTTLPTYFLPERSLTEICLFHVFRLATHPPTPPGLPAQAKKHAESAKNTLLTWKDSTTSNKEKEEILDALVMLYYTLGVACLLQNRYPSFPSGDLVIGARGPLCLSDGPSHTGVGEIEPGSMAVSQQPDASSLASLSSPSRKVGCPSSVCSCELGVEPWRDLTGDTSPSQVKNFRHLSYLLLSTKRISVGSEDAAMVVGGMSGRGRMGGNLQHCGSCNPLDPLGSFKKYCCLGRTPEIVT